jgi:hypothetical protein
MRRSDHAQGQTGIAILARVVALVALGVAIYPYLQAVPRDGLQTQLNVEVVRGPAPVSNGRIPTGQAAGVSGMGIEATYGITASWLPWECAC